MTAVDLAPGQRWAFRDYRYEGWRYLTITELTAQRVHATTNTRRKHTDMSRTRFGRGSRWTFCGHDGPGVLPAYATRPVGMGCLNCPPKPNVLPLETGLAPGFGYTGVYRDGERIWSTCHETRKRVAHVELWARETPGDWRIRFDDAIWERLYQRQGSGNWVLVAIGMGFA